MSSKNAPIKINISMTSMAMTPKHDILPPTSSSLKCKRSPITPYHPSSPISPVNDTPAAVQPFPSLKSEASDVDFMLKKEMMNRGYIPTKKIASTLQGSVWKTTKSGRRYVIKVAQKSLYEKNMACVDGTLIPVQEDVIKECAILRYLTSNNPNPSLATFESFFSDSNNFYLVMEDAGTALFEMVQKCHNLINSGKLSIAEWHRFCKIAFRQMTQLIDWLHNDMNCCHLDLSLENFVISNVMVIVKGKDQFVFHDDFTIKIIDFGLAEVFTNENTHASKVSFECAKYVGKTFYKCPIVYHKRRTFDARAADVWSLGVVLFMMVVGGSPYKLPTKSDASFRYVINGKIVELLKSWKRTQYVTPAIVDLMRKIFKKEKYRYNIYQIKSHPWLL